MSSIKRGYDKICQTKEGIVFAFQGKWKDNESHELNSLESIDKSNEGISQISTYENYAKEKLRRPEYQTIRISLERLVRSLALIEGSWQSTNRHHAQRELGNMLYRIHEIEKEIEN